MILIKNVNVVSKDLISNVIRMLKNNSDFDFILIIHLNEDLDKLDYLRDYFNFMVHIPSLDNRNLSERFQFIEKFFQNESYNFLVREVISTTGTLRSFPRLMIACG